MSIQIYNDGLAGAGASEAARTQDVSRAGGGGRHTSGAASGGEDQVEISALSSSLAAQGSARSARVDQLAATYQSGNYQVNSQDVSRSIVDRALQAGAVGGDQS
ncbi:MAG TPA: flagellar biosynthesis anti-sigma factor FlgM [Bryobacteraceae bacterium]|jgi:anti-sigma28 factor (negative regulator of flagellin synthesis)|nr:flagellar biosynthesis anti-sigma factor FlgM [Bryobacteraceae bacterium]